MMDFLSKFDILSPKITLYQNGKLTHFSLLSGILTLLSLFFCLVVGMLLADDIIRRKNPTSHFFKRFEKDLDLYSLNSSGIFHFLVTGEENNILNKQNFQNLIYQKKLMNQNLYYQFLFHIYHKSNIQYYLH